MSNGAPTGSENRYHQLIRTSPAPINLFGASGEIIWGNDAVVDLLGLESTEQPIGRSIFDFVQTIFEMPSEMTKANTIREGYGEGSFVGIRASP